MLQEFASQSLDLFQSEKPGQIKATVVAVVVSEFKSSCYFQEQELGKIKECWYSCIATLELSSGEQQFAKTLLFPVQWCIFQAVCQGYWQLLQVLVLHSAFFCP